MNDNHQSHCDKSDDILDCAIRAATSQPQLAELADVKNRLLEQAAAFQGSDDSSSIGAAKRQESNWRTMIRRPAARYFAAAALLVAVGAVVVWFYSGGTSPAFADFIRPILDAKSVKFKMTTEDSFRTTADVLVLAPYRMRAEKQMPDNVKMVMILDGETGRSLILFPDEKRATVVTPINVPKERRPTDFFATFRTKFLDARDDPSYERTSRGEKDIDGRRALGYRLSGHGMLIDVWGDPRTGLPIRAEITAPSMPNVKAVIYSDFEFNVDLDESLFSTEPPAGYSVKEMGDPPVLPKAEPQQQAASPAEE